MIPYPPICSDVSRGKMCCDFACAASASDIPLVSAFASVSELHDHLCWNHTRNRNTQKTYWLQACYLSPLWDLSPFRSEGETVCLDAVFTSEGNEFLWEGRVFSLGATPSETLAPSSDCDEDSLMWQACSWVDFSGSVFGGAEVLRRFCCLMVDRRDFEMVSSENSLFMFSMFMFSDG